jgi:hypothetical protein
MLAGLTGGFDVANRLYNVGAICSGVVFCLLLAASMAAYHVDPRKRFLSPRPGVHITIDSRFGPAIEVFSDASYGPYTGSIISISAPGKAASVRSEGFDGIGVYYRCFRWPGGTSLWTLSVSLIYFLALSAVPPVIWIARRARRVDPSLQSG